MDNDLNKIKITAIDVAMKAGKYAFKHMGKLKTISCKDEGYTNLVTDVDKECEKIIIEYINKKFPSHSILAEESGEHSAGSAFKWIIDPIDGTTNYAHGFPVFCVSIGVALEDRVKIGVVYDPTRDELFSAEENKGGFLNKTRIKVSKSKKLRNSLIATGFAYNLEARMANLGYFKKMLEKCQAVRRLGSAAIDICYVACARLDGFWERDLSPWDTAGAQVIVKEAGGSITTFNNDPFDVFKKEVVATNGHIHKEMLTLLQ